MDAGFGCVASLSQFGTAAVFFLVGFSIGNHSFDIGVAQTGVSLNRDLVFLAGSLILSGNMKNTVGVNIECHFDLRQSSRSRSDAFKVEFAKQLVVCCHFTFALVNLNGYSRLIVFGSREHLRVLCRDRGVALDHRSHHAAQGFNTEGKRCNVEKQNVAAVAGQNSALNSSTHSNGFIRVHVLTRILLEEFLNSFLNSRHTCLTADEDNVGDVFNSSVGILQGLAARFDCSFNQIFAEAFELRTCQCDVQMFRTCCISSDVRQVDFCFLTAGQLDLGLFSGVFQTLQSQNVLTQVNACVLLEFFDDVVNDSLVEVFAAKECIAVGGQNFKLFFTVNIG